MRGRYLIILIVMSIFLLLEAGCQEQANKQEEPGAVLTPPKQIAGPKKAETIEQAGKTGPKITFEKAAQDFGEVGPGIKRTSEFKFTNTGDSLLEITKVEGCCGVITKLDKMQYEPGESGTIKVEYSTSSVAGVMNRQLHVVSNDKTNPRAALTIKAKIVPKISYEPQRGLKILLKGEQTSCPEITITSLDGKPFAIKGFISTGNCLTADYDPSVEATKFVLQPKVDVEKLQKQMNGFVHIRLTHPENNTIAIAFNAVSRFKITPPQIVAFNAEPGKSITRKIWVLNNYEEEFEIESISSQNDIIKVRSQDAIKNGYQFILEITPPAKESEAGFTDVLLVKIKGQKELEVKCRGFYLKKKE
jgi:hypothetical protein